MAIIRPLEMQNTRMFFHCVDDQRFCTFAHKNLMCITYIPHNDDREKCPRIVMEINALLFDMNSIELLLLKIKPNNGEDLW